MSNIYEYYENCSGGETTGMGESDIAQSSSEPTPLESFAKLITENKIKFTKPQQVIVDHILRGDKLITVNQHHQSGGQMMWIRKGDTDPSYAGHVYKAYQHMCWTIRKATRVDPDMSFAWDRRRNVVVK